MDANRDALAPEGAVQVKKSPEAKKPAKTNQALWTGGPSKEQPGPANRLTTGWDFAKDKQQSVHPAAKSWSPPNNPNPGATLVTPVLTGWPSFPSSAPQDEPQVAQLRQSSPSRSPNIIAYDPKYLAELKALLHSVEELKNSGYVLANLTADELDAKRRCQACGKFIRKPNKKLENWKSSGRIPQATSPRKTSQITSKPTMSTVNSSTSMNPISYTGAGLPTGRIYPNGHPSADTTPLKRICHFHPGVADRKLKIWTCCKKKLSENPCCGESEHTPVIYAPGQLENQWEYFHTPRISQAQTSKIRPAVAIDCEMGTALDGDSELIRVTLLDYFTGDTLIDRLVYPDVPMEHYNTRFSGVTRGMMDSARSQNTCLFGKSKARDAVWEYIDPETIVIGHSAYNDLKSMRWIHRCIIDTFLLEPKPTKESHPKDEGEKKQVGVINSQSTASKSLNSKDEAFKCQTESLESSRAAPKNVGAKIQLDEAPPPPKQKAPKGTGPRALKTLARVKLGREIQNAGRKGHDSYEDALAARDLVHWAILDRRAGAVAESEPQARPTDYSPHDIL